MPEFILLPIKAMEELGFRQATSRNETLGTAETLIQAQKMAMDIQGAAIFRMRQPVGLPDQPGGHQPFGEPLTELKDLKWLCLVQVLIPGTAGWEHVESCEFELVEAEEVA